MMTLRALYICNRYRDWQSLTSWAGLLPFEQRRLLSALKAFTCSPHASGKCASHAKVPSRTPGAVPSSLCLFTHAVYLQLKRVATAKGSVFIHRNNPQQPHVLTSHLSGTTYCLFSHRPVLCFAPKTRLEGFCPGALQHRQPGRSGHV